MHFIYCSVNIISVTDIVYSLLFCDRKPIFLGSKLIFKLIEYKLCLVTLLLLLHKPLTYSVTVRKVSLDSIKGDDFCDCGKTLNCRNHELKENLFF